MAFFKEDHLKFCVNKDFFITLLVQNKKNWFRIVFHANTPLVFGRTQKLLLQTTDIWWRSNLWWTIIILKFSFTLCFNFCSYIKQIGRVNFQYFLFQNVHYIYHALNDFKSSSLIPLSYSYSESPKVLLFSEIKVLNLLTKNYVEQ